MVGDDYCGRSFLGECGGTIYGDLTVKGTILNKENKEYITESRVLELINQEIGNLEEALQGIIAIQEELMLPDGDEVKY
jgi:hypothetical protein